MTDARGDGRNKTGYCKLCRSEFAPALNKLLEEGKNAGEVTRAMEPFGLSFDRATLRKHKAHITHPLVTAVDAARQSPVIVPKTNAGVLEAIRELGIRRAIEHPDEVTVDHALKAASILERRNEKTDINIILAKIVTGESLPEEYTLGPGEYQVLDEEES